MLLSGWRNFFQEKVRFTDFRLALNDAQKSAVESLKQHSLALAGTGSEKTRVLVSRMAYLIDKHRFVNFSGLIAKTVG